ncbi:transcriptional regulator [Acrocarpospora phusangensis]|uniref:Transcriptional regulator n=1 Tax=Acrocarpospora phusangensis TaxID=1070424 RepID=A0A919UMQ7_9ACTN|nr:helix-turn-helix transcriptional regulator [Acrocarpospora phusangensis]GIH27601.1 transcriptional regulator [Acrocarpospora phusangensis]
MSNSQSSSVQEARRAIAARLREILRDAGLTSRALAREAGWEESKCSRLLSGRTPPSDEDIRAWCRICGAENEIPNLIAASRNAESAYLEWRRVSRSQKHMQDLALKLFSEPQYRFYSSNLVPWPLQVPSYMRAIMLRFNDFHQSAASDVEEAVQVRVARRRFLKDGSRSCALIIEESVLRNRLFDDDTSLDQLRYLLVGMRQPNVSLGIIPSEARRIQRLTETFHIYGENTVSIELTSAIITITQPWEIALYVRCFNRLAGSAVYGVAAEEIIHAAIEALE